MFLNNKIILIFSILLILEFTIISLNASEIAKTNPVITKLKQVDEDTVEVYINDESPTSGPPIRSYVVIYKDYEITPIPWPTQLEKVDYDLVEDHSSFYIYTSATFCFANCIPSMSCKFAKVERSTEQGKIYCYYYDTLGNYKDALPGSEYALVKSFTNPIVLKNLTYGHTYEFTIRLYDADGSSHKVNKSEPITIMPQLEVSVIRYNLTSALIKWNQIGEFTNYPYSRFKILLYRDEHDLDEYDVADNLTSFKFTPYEGADKNIIANYSAKSEDECIKLCLAQTRCVLSAYYNKTIFHKEANKCYLYDGFEYVNEAKYVNAVNSVKCNAKEVIVPIKWNVEYKVKIRGTTPHGMFFYSNEVPFIIDHYELSINQIVVNGLSANFKCEFNINTTDYGRPELFYSVNNTNDYQYFMQLSPDYEDPNEKEVDGADDETSCFESCYQDDSCVAFTLRRKSNFGPLICILKYTKRNPKKCPPNGFCAEMLELNNSNIKINNILTNAVTCWKLSLRSKARNESIESNQVCTELSTVVKVKALSTFVEGESAVLFCDTKLDETSLYYIIWLSSTHLINLTSSDYSTNEDESILIIKRLNATRDNGEYGCEVHFRNGQILKSYESLKVDVKSPVKLFINKNVTEFHEDSEVKISCVCFSNEMVDLEWSATSTNKTFNTYQEGSIIYLKFDKITKQDSDTYTCSIKNNLLVESQSIDIQVLTKPSKPIILNATSLSHLKSTFIQWNLKTFVMDNLTKVVIELASINETEILFLVGDQLLSNSLIINTISTNNTKARMRAENMVGSSEFSDYFLIQCLDCDQIVAMNVTERIVIENKSKNILLTGLTIALGAVVLILLTAIVVLKKDAFKRIYSNRSNFLTFKNDAYDKNYLFS